MGHLKKTNKVVKREYSNRIDISWCWSVLITHDRLEDNSMLSELSYYYRGRLIEAINISQNEIWFTFMMNYDRSPIAAIRAFNNISIKESLHDFLDKKYSEKCNYIDKKIGLPL